jgi:hypothetical protein
MVITLCRDAIKAAFFVVECFDIALGDIRPCTNILWHETDAEGIIAIVKTVYCKTGVFVAEHSTELDVGKGVADSSMAKHNFKPFPLLHFFLRNNGMEMQQEKQAAQTGYGVYSFHHHPDKSINVYSVNIFYFFSMRRGEYKFMQVDVGV